MSLCFLSLETSKVFNELILEELEKKDFEGLTSSLITIFPYIDEAKEISISKLALKLSYSRQAMHKNLKKLEEYEYIYFKEGLNKKEKLVSLDKKGEKLVNFANNFIESIEEELNNEIGEEKLLNFISLQNKIFNVLKHKQIKN